ncbi:MAG: helix-turn-helix transcriptional regulator [Pseudomonadota bacterium]
MRLDHTPSPLPAFGRRLRQLRRARGIKQLALAQMAGVDQTTVSRWEAGKIRPGLQTQRTVIQALAAQRSEDRALKRLVEDARSSVHLVEEATHVCLAYSRKRAEGWQVSPRAMLGISLWPFATDEIRAAEATLAETGWFDDYVPEPRHFLTSAGADGDIRIDAGQVTWERVYLSDGTPARLVSGSR